MKILFLCFLLLIAGCTAGQKSALLLIAAGMGSGMETFGSSLQERNRQQSANRLNCVSTRNGNYTYTNCY